MSDRRAMALSFLFIGLWYASIAAILVASFLSVRHIDG